jgi:Predicted esterase of the alpha-beta hydrolase superfamily
MTSLILEGGTFRPIFSAGVMDALLEHDIILPYIIGVSAGITNGLSYVSKQKERNLEIITKFRNDKRYIGKRNFIKEKSIFGLKFAFEEIPNQLVPFDYETFNQYNGKIIVGVTNAANGKAEYLDGKIVDEKNSMIRATCSIPGFFPACKLNNKEYFDGGISDSIPIVKAIDDGNKKHLIILTQPKDFKKRPNKTSKLIAKLLEKKYPLLAKTMRNRHNQYNQSLNICKALERDGKALIIQPNKKISSFEKDVNVLKEAYLEGKQYVYNHINEIKKFIKD